MKHYDLLCVSKHSSGFRKLPVLPPTPTPPPPPPPQSSPTEVITSQDNTVKFSLEILNPHIAPFVIRIRMLGIIDNK